MTDPKLASTAYLKSCKHVWNIIQSMQAERVMRTNQSVRKLTNQGPGNWNTLPDSSKLLFIWEAMEND